MVSGSIQLSHKRYPPSTPSKAIRSGIAYLTEERKKDGFIPLMSSFANATLPILKRFRHLRGISHDAADEFVSTSLAKMNILGNFNDSIWPLSGGDQ